MRFHLFAAVSAVALLATGAHAQDMTSQPAPAPAAQAGAVTDAELASFARAMASVRTVMEGVQGGQPTGEQQAAMASAITDSGLTIDQFNAISGRLSNEPVLRARVALAAAPASTEGSVEAGVTDAELAQFAPAYARVRDIAVAANGAPSAEQQAEMAGIIQNSGLTIDRFNEISGALSSDQRLQARVALAEAQAG